ncbi:MAG: inositol monophosphatase family protein [Patescibacteria group bacterium]
MRQKPKFKKFKKVAQSAAKKAGEYLLKNFLKIHRQSNFKFKSDHEIVTRFDFGAESIILQEIRKNFPRHDILSEEAGFKNFVGKDFLWICDPLDGTTNFSIKNPLFAVSVALAYQGEIVLGVVFVPVLSELFTAQKGKGAYLNGKKIFVSRTNKIEKSFLTYCHSYKKKHIRRAVEIYRFFKLRSYDIRQLGSAAAEFVWVARGLTEAIMIPGANPWDVAAGSLLVKEAGGRVTDFQNKDWNLKSRDIVASNGKIHQDILKILRKI